MSSHSVPSVLITRPIGQQQDFALRCTKLGFDVSLLPCLLIVAIPVSQQSLLTLLSTHEAVLFTSTNAVRCAHAILPLPWPDTVVHAIGAATASSLQNHGQAVHLQPQAPFNSEAYLSQLEQQTPASLLIIKGEGGRGLIQPRLVAAGWKVNTLDVYRRVIPSHSPQLIDAVFAPTQPDIISVTSDEILKNLHQLCQPHWGTLCRTALVVNSERCASLACELGFSAETLVAMPPGDAGQLECLDHWKNNHHKPAS